MSPHRFAGKSLLMAAFVMVAITFASSLPAQVAPGIQQQAEAIPTTRARLGGRLFFSRDERERLDRMHSGRASVAGADDNGPQVPTINGFVKRTGGETAVWVDGEMLTFPLDMTEKIVPAVVGGSANTLRVTLGSDALQISRKAAAKRALKKRAGKVSVPAPASILAQPRN